MPTISLLVCSALMVFVAACGADQTPSFPTAPAGDATPAGSVNATASLSGKIVFEGQVPKPGKIQMTADPYCAQHNQNPYTETVKVSDGGLENAILYLSSGLEGNSFPTPSEPLLLDQRDCQYIPHVFTIQVNQPMQVKNSDKTAHNVHAWPGKATPFNVGQPVQGMVFSAQFDQEEMPVAIRCDIHKWMNSYVGVFNHPFHTVSKAGGMYGMKIPAGKYEVTAWHEEYGTQKAMVDVVDNGEAVLNFTFKSHAGASD